MISDLFLVKILGKYPLLEKMQQLADADAEKLSHVISEAIKEYQPKKIIIVTHVLPFKEACLYEGKISGDDFLPFFSSKTTGNVLLQAAKNHPDINFFIFCSHTHNKAFYQLYDNLIVKVGQAEYNNPEIQEIIKF